MPRSLAVVLEDNHLLAVAKPAGVPVVPDESGDDSLLDMAKRYLKRKYAKPGEVFLGVVHRLDRPVSGLVLFARTSKAAGRLSTQWRMRSVEKVYRAVVHGSPPSEDGTIVQWLRKDTSRNVVEVLELPDVKQACVVGAKQARTAWKVLQRRSGRALLQLEPLTGRPHQLRLACASLGTPIEGDLKYGAPAALPDRSIALHAAELGFDHPTRGERMQLAVDPPPVFSELLPPG